MDFPGKFTNEGDEKEESNDKESDEEESGEDKGDEDDNSQAAKKSSSKIHSQCKYYDNIAQNYIERSHIFRTEKNNKKYYYYVLR